MWSFFKRVNNLANKHEIVLILLLFTVIFRIPSLFEPFWYGDENIYLAIGQGIRSGLTLYADITDYPNKPPAIYLLAALVKTVANFRLLLLFWHLTGVAAFFYLLRKITRNQTTAFFSTLAFIYLTATPILEGNIANAEIFFIMVTILGVLFLYPDGKKITDFRPQLIPSFLGGLFLGLSFLFKIHVALDILAVGLFFYAFSFPNKISSLIKPVFNPSAWVFSVGVLLPIGIVLTIWSTMGVPPQNLLSNAAGSSAYVSIWDSQDVLGQTIGMGSLQARVVALGLFIGLMYLIRHWFSPQVIFASLWLGLTLFAALLSGRPYPHYLLQIIPALIVLGALLFTPVPRWRERFLVFFMFLLSFAAYQRFDFGLWAVKSYYHNFGRYITGQIDRTEYYQRFDNRMSRNYATAEFVREITTSEDRMYIWGTDPGVYVMADRLPIEKLVTSFHVDDLDYFDETLEALENQKPEVIVVMETEWRHFPGLDTLLANEYVLINRIGDAGKQAKIYKLL